MTVSKTIISDADILMLIEQDNNKGWEYLYDKYAAMMYGAILRVTDNTVLADKILVRSFLNCKKNRFFAATKTSLCLALLRVANAAAKEILGKNGVGIKMQDQSDATFPILNSLLFHSLSLKDCAALHTVTEGECKSMLSIEINQWRLWLKEKGNAT